MSKIHIGRPGSAPVDTEYLSPHKQVAVVKSFHEPPQFVVFTNSSNGWLKENSFKGRKAAIKYAHELTERFG